MLAEMLHKSGVFMGNDFRKPLPENPKGFFEQESFRILNDRLLEQSGYIVKEWSDFFAGILNAKMLKAEARQLILQNCSLRDSWGWKDPRTCLTLGFWLGELEDLQLLDKVKIIKITRRRDAICRSLCRRGNLDNHAHGIRLINLYMDCCDLAISNYAGRTNVLTTPYEGIVSGNSIPEMEHFFGMHIDTSTRDKSYDNSRRGCRCRESVD